MSAKEEKWKAFYPLRKEDATISITFGECVENHAGMQKIGTTHSPGGGLTMKDLRSIQSKFKKGESTLIDFSEYIDSQVPEAGLLIIPNGVNRLLAHRGTADEMFEEHSLLETDKKMFAYGGVKNKIARHNLCFADFPQESDFDEGKGTIVQFGDEIPLTTILRRRIGYLHPKIRGLYAEGNYYYSRDCACGRHGDEERRIVVCARLGADFPIAYQWYKDGEKQGEMFETSLKGGDLYIMSENAVGTMWLKDKKGYTLRHWASLKPIKEKVKKPRKKSCGTMAVVVDEIPTKKVRFHGKKITVTASSSRKKSCGTMAEIAYID